MPPRSPLGTVRRVPKGTPKSKAQLALEELQARLDSISLTPGPQGPPGPPGEPGQRPIFGAEEALLVKKLLEEDSEFKESLKGKDGKDGETKFIGGGGSPPTVKYLPVRVASRTFKARDFIAGTNIIGVDYDGNVTITLPPNLASDRYLVVKDESGNAGTYSITVQT